MKTRHTAGILVLAFLFIISAAILTGCGRAAATEDIMSGITPNAVNAAGVPTDAETEAAAGAVADFAIKIFQNGANLDENPLISPLSVLCALGMTANGASGETLAQMEQVFGLTVPQLNAYLRMYIQDLLTNGECKLSLAGSIWFKDAAGLSVERDFLQANADWYGAEIYKAAFDSGTLDAINGWVSKSTDGMIGNVLDRIPDDVVMYLINTLAFDAEWREIYNQMMVRDRVFTALSGVRRDAKMMYSGEHSYLEDDNAVGFIKPYADGRYAFAALLPNEDISLEDYIASLTGGGLLETLNNVRRVKVDAAIPKFKSEYSLEMSDILTKMGIPDAFDPKLADFSRLGRSDEGNLYISRVLHKTFIAVDERGTKAGAATVVEVRPESAPIEEIKRVHLDRPFVYMLIDLETNLPFFIGAVTDIA